MKSSSKQESVSEETKNRKKGKRRLIVFVALFVVLSMLALALCYRDQIMCSVAKKIYEYEDGEKQPPENLKKPMFVFVANLYRRAAEHGNARGQYNLGVCYNDGIGVEQDDNEAIKWYRLSAEKGYSRAQHNLGICYYKGVGVEQDYLEAVKWLRKAAEQNLPESYAALGACYYFGEGVDANKEEAAKWLKKAADLGLADAQDVLKMLDTDK